MKIIKLITFRLLLACSSTLLLAPGLYASETDAKTQAATDQQNIEELLRTIDHGNIKLAEIVLERIDDIQRLCKKEPAFLPLHRAKTPEMVTLLLRHKADPNYKKKI